MKKPKKSTLLPLALLIYLAAMAYIGRYSFYTDGPLYYFGIITATLACIIALHFALKRRERLRREREDDLDQSPANPTDDDK